MAGTETGTSGTGPDQGGGELESALLEYLSKEEAGWVMATDAASNPEDLALFARYMYM